VSWSAFLGGLFLAAAGYTLLGFREAIFSLSSRLDPLRLLKRDRWIFMPMLVIISILTIVIGIGYMVAALVHAFFSMG
jgi:hypothetical protein